MNYTLEAIINGKVKKFGKKFSSRQNAINFMFDYLENAYLFNKQVNDEYILEGNKHKVEYVLDYYNRFIVTRV